MKKILSLMFFFCFLLTGCNNNIEINENINGKTIIYSKIDFSYYISDKNIKKRIQVRYKGKICPIFCIIQNKDKSLAAIKISTLSSKNYNRKLGIINMPQRFILLVSGNHVIYKLESPELTSIQWINNTRLLIVSKKRRIIINERGQIIEDKSSSGNQLKNVPQDSIF